MSPPNRIDLYMHCQQCIDELPNGVTPAEFSRLEIGITGPPQHWLQVWCRRHKRNVALFKADMTEVEVDLT